MSEEEENPEVLEQQKEAEEADKAKPESEGNALYKTLFDIAEEATEEVEEKEQYRPPVDLNEAVAVLDEPNDEPTEEVEEEEKKEEPQKAEPKKKKLRKVVDPDIPEDVKKQPEYTQPEEVEYKVDSDEEEFMNDLIPEERVVYEKILYADKKIGGDYKGASKKFKDFVKKNKEYLEKKSSEDEYYDPASDENYKNFVNNNKPKFTRLDEDKVYREMILEEAEKRATKRTSNRIEELENQLKKQEYAPKVEQAKTQFRKVAQESVIPKEFHDVFVEGGDAIKNFADSNPLEYKILEKNTSELLSLSDTLTEIFMDPTTQIDISGNEVHKYLNDWIQTEQDNFIKSGQTENEGKLYMRRERYYQLPESKRSEYYTWSDNDVLKLLAIRYSDKVKSELDSHRKMLEKAGYVRQSANPEPKEPQQKIAPKQVTKPPVVNATPRQGSSVESKQAPKQTNALMSALGL